MGEVFNILGVVGSLMLASSLLPQMYKIYKTKSAKDLSLTFQLTYLLGLAMICTYGYGRSLWAVYIPCTIEFCVALMQFAMKLYYDGLERKRELAKAAEGESPEVEVEIASAVSSTHRGAAVLVRP